MSDRGELVTFEFTPLMAHDEAHADSILITGTPRYGTSRVPRSVRSRSAARQRAARRRTERAAALEREGIARARTALERDVEARELMAETRSTGDALRSVTGQDRR